MITITNNGQALASTNYWDAGVAEGHALYAAACAVHSPRGTP